MDNINDTKRNARTIKEVAELLNISTQMVYKLIRRGELDAFKIGNAVRVLESDIDAYIQRQKQLYRMEVMNEKADETSQEHPLVLKDVSVRKGDFTVGPVSVKIPPRAVVAIAGGSGSGKTSLLRGLNGLEKLESGTVSIGQVDLTYMPIEERRIGFVFQDSVLLPKMSVEENLTFPLRVRKVAEPGRTDRLNQIIDELDIDRSYLEKYEEQLPAGIRQLTAIGKERMHMLDLLLMDEPMCHLDAHLKSEIRVLIHSIVHKLGKTTLLALNEPEDIMAMCDYVLVLDEGHVVQYGPVQEIYKKPKEISSLEALSHLGINQFQIEVKNGQTYPFGLPAEGYEDGKYEFCFRPQDVKPGGPDDISIAEIQRTVYDGNHDLVTVKVNQDKATIVLERGTLQTNSIRLEHYFLFPAE